MRSIIMEELPEVSPTQEAEAMRPPPTMEKSVFYKGLYALS
jgi:hypothetical protein